MYNSWLKERARAAHVRMILRCLVAAVVIAQERWGFCDFAGLLEGLNINRLKKKHLTSEIRTFGFKPPNHW